MRRNWKFQQQDAARNHLEEHGIMKPVQDEFEGLSRKRRIEADVTVGANAVNTSLSARNAGKAISESTKERRQLQAPQGPQRENSRGSQLGLSYGYPPQTLGAFQHRAPQEFHLHARDGLQPQAVDGFQLHDHPGLQLPTPPPFQPPASHGFHPNAAHGFSAAQGLKPQALPGSRLYPNNGFQLETPQPLHPHASQRFRPDEPHGFHLQLPPAIQQHSPHGLRPQPPHGYLQPHPGLSYTVADARRELIQQRAAHRTTVEKMEADHKHQQKTALAGQEIADRSRRRLTNLLLETRDMIHQAYMEADPKETRRMLETCGQHLEKSLYEEDDRVEAEIEEAS
jgi:hypothetical protein